MLSFFKVRSSNWVKKGASNKELTVLLQVTGLLCTFSFPKRFICVMKTLNKIFYAEDTKDKIVLHFLEIKHAIYIFNFQQHLILIPPT